MGILIFTTVLLTFFAGVAVGVALVIFTDNSAPHVKGQEDSFQPE